MCAAQRAIDAPGSGALRVRGAVAGMCWRAGSCIQTVALRLRIVIVLSTNGNLSFLESSTPAGRTVLEGGMRLWRWPASKNSAWSGHGPLEREGAVSRVPIHRVGVRMLRWLLATPAAWVGSGRMCLRWQNRWRAGVGGGKRACNGRTNYVGQH
jgi:hypothetical protein